MYQPPGDGELNEIKIEVTRDCMLACVHCSSNASAGHPLHLSREVVLSLVSQAAEMQVRSIVFSGGEPLLWPWLSEAIGACSAYGLRCSIYSTGIDHSHGAQELVALANYGLHKVAFSLYSSHKEQHEQVTTKADSFDKTLLAIAKTKGGGLEREIHFVSFRRNLAHLELLVELAREMKMSRVSVLRLVPHGRGVVFKRSQEMLTPEQCIELRNIILKCRNFGVKVRVGSPYNILLLEKEVECDAARGTLIVGPNGNLYPCDAFKNIEPCDLGLEDPYNNVLAHPLRRCWENSLYLNAIRRYLSTPFEEPCSSCPNLDKCKSGCLAQKVIEQESILGGSIVKTPDPLCLKTFMGGSRASR